MATYGKSMTITYTAWDTSANAPKTGDSANHTLRWIKDGTAAAPTNSASEVDATNAPGEYKVTLTSAEAQTPIGKLAGASSTADVSIIPVSIAFEHIPDAAPDAAGGLPVSDAGGLDLDTLLGALNGHTAQTGDSFAIVNGDHGLVSIQDDIDALQAKIVGTLAAGTHNPQTGDSFAITNSGTHGLAALKVLIDVIDGIVDGILVDTAEIGPAGAGFTALPWNSSWDAEVQSEVTDALNEYDPPTKAEMDTGFAAIPNAVQNRQEMDNNSTQFSQILTDIAGISTGSAPTLLQSTTIATLASQTSFTLTAGSSDDDAYNDAILIAIDQASSTQKAFARVEDYVGSTKTITLASAPAFTVAVGDTVNLIATGETNLTDSQINQISGTVIRSAAPVFSGSVWTSPFVVGDAYIGGNRPTVTIENWSGDQAIADAASLKISGTKTSSGSTTTFSVDLTPGDVTVNGSTTTIYVEMTAAETGSIAAGEYTADIRASWTSNSEVYSIVQPTFKIVFIDPVSTF